MLSLKQETALALALLIMFGATQAFIVNSQVRLADTEEDETRVTGASEITTRWGSRSVTTRQSPDIANVQEWLERHAREVEAARARFP